jgi:hypothetical protein
MLRYLSILFTGKGRLGKLYSGRDTYKTIIYHKDEKKAPEEINVWRSSCKNSDIKYFNHWARTYPIYKIGCNWLHDNHRSSDTYIDKWEFQKSPVLDKLVELRNNSSRFFKEAIKNLVKKLINEIKNTKIQW